MSLVYGWDSFSPPPTGVALTIGNFDGVHLGHARLIAAALKAAAAHGTPPSPPPVVAVTFDPHPLAILAPDRAPPLLTTLPQRAALLQALGVATTLVIPTTAALLSLSAEDFLEQIVARLRPFAFIEGPTFNFGRGRAGSNETLRRHATRLGYEVIVVDELTAEALPGQPEINSTAIRGAILRGDLPTAQAMLGRPYQIRGTVESGDGRGAKIGFPTANLHHIRHLLPAEGVYAARARVIARGPAAPAASIARTTSPSADRSLNAVETAEFTRPAAVNIGPQPTFGQSGSRVEAHLLDFSGDLRGREIELDLLERLRGQIRFDGIDALRAQLAADVGRARAICPTS